MSHQVPILSILKQYNCYNSIQLYNSSIVEPNILQNIMNELPWIARFVGPTWGPSGDDRTQVRPCWPHEPCYLVGQYHTFWWYITRPTARSWFNTKMLSYLFRKSQCGDKMIVRSSYLHNGISYTSKIPSLYWVSLQDAWWLCMISMFFFTPLSFLSNIHKTSVHKGLV